MPQDLDQGGSYREWIKTYFGPTLGWIYIQVQNTNLASSVVGNSENVTVGGTTIPDPASTLIQVNTAAVVTIQLNSSIPPSNTPTLFMGLPITIVDKGGHANVYNITILPFAGELIAGQASITISAAYGAYTLLPIATGGWNIQ